MHIDATAKSDVGRVRERNEDYHLVNEDLGLFVVADGMGGHAGGARASRLAVETLEAFFTARKNLLEAAKAPEEDDPAPPLAQLLVQGVRAACAAVYDAAAADPSLSGMGTTCTLLLVRPGWAYVGHVGDSRCYMQRGTRFLQVTEDHSLVNEQVRAGLLAPEDAAKSRLKNIITRSVGFEREVEVDTFLVPLHPGDQFLLCSDGLSNLVENSELGEAMMAMRGDALANFLVDVALERGGDDNVTTVCVRVTDGPEADAADAAPTEAASNDLSQTAPEFAGAPAPEAPPAQELELLDAGGRAARQPGLAPGIPPAPTGAGGRGGPGPDENTDPRQVHPAVPRPSTPEAITDPEGLAAAELPTDPGPEQPARRRPKRR